METHHRYVIVGAGLAGASAVEGIRERDDAGPILLLGAERHLPYDRPPLSKQLWFGKKKVGQLYPHDLEWYGHRSVELALGVRATRLELDQKAVVDERGDRHRFEKLLLATGGAPRKLPIPGGDLEGVCYFRTLDDFQKVRAQAGRGRSAVVIGGGFIGSELAAALTQVQTAVTMVFPERYLGQRVFPERLGRFLQEQFRGRGIRVLDGDVPTSISVKGSRLVTRTRGGEQLSSDLVIAGVGLSPSIELAREAGLEVGDGIEVNASLQASHPEVFVAGDNARFPYAALGERMRVEHWDNAVAQGKLAGRNMAGADEPYLHMPYFFSDLFDFGYEAVGRVDARLETIADWIDELRTGTVYYVDRGKVRGAMMCNVWGKVDDARIMVREGAAADPERLRGALR